MEVLPGEWAGGLDGPRYVPLPVRCVAYTEFGSQGLHLEDLP